jgi:hypothetical protein
MITALPATRLGRTDMLLTRVGGHAGFPGRLAQPLRRPR